MQIDSCFKIGFVQKTHGLKGELTLSLENDAPDDLGMLKSVFVEDGDRLVPYFIDSISLNGNKAFVKFEEIDSIGQAEKLVRKSLYLEKSQRPKKARGEFYDDEIIGFGIFDAEAGELGMVTEIIQAGANKLLSVDNKGKELLIPVNAPFIISINKSKKQIRVDLPEGYLDI